MLSGRAMDNDDPLSRRDQGLEFLDVTQQVRIDRIDSDRARNTEHVFRLTNTSDSVVDTHLLIVVRGLPAGVRLKNASGTAHNGEPYIRVLRDRDRISHASATKPGAAGRLTPAHSSGSS
jgi:hypothetical protein